MCRSLQCSPLLKVRRLIQKTGSAWRCVLSISAHFYRTKLSQSVVVSFLFSFSRLVIFFLISFPTQTPKRVEVHSIHTYVALYKFLPQEKNDLELQLVKLPSILFLCVCELEEPGEKGHPYTICLLSRIIVVGGGGSNWEAGGDHAGWMGRTKQLHRVCVRKIVFVCQQVQLTAECGATVTTNTADTVWQCRRAECSDKIKVISLWHRAAKCSSILILTVLQSLCVCPCVQLELVISNQIMNFLW